MNIAQALKEKNKVTSELSKLWSRFRQYNSVNSGETQAYDPAKTWDDILIAQIRLVDLKTRIHDASSPVRSKIFSLSEKKAQIQNLRGLDTTSGTMNDRYSGAPIVRVATFNILWKDQMIEKIESEIEEIQEELDRFNHTTQI